MSRAYNFCNNCGETGHAFHQCKKPITSIGLIVYKEDPATNQRHFLMICRKDTLGFVDFMRGKYHIQDANYIKNIIKEMTLDERERILTNSFDELWNGLWGENIGIQYRGEERISRDKMKTLKSGVLSGNDYYNLESLVKSVEAEWKEPEWGFPKGRRNYQERDIACAIREFEEETGYSASSLQLIQNICPLEEVFTGSNYKSYKHRYFLAKMNNDESAIPDNYQKTEVSAVEWFTAKEALEKIRPYNLEKKEVLTRANTLLSRYRICS